MATRSDGQKLTPSFSLAEVDELFRRAKQNGLAISTHEFDQWKSDIVAQRVAQEPAKSSSSGNVFNGLV